jgi:hypothetical protein
VARFHKATLIERYEAVESMPEKWAGSVFSCCIPFMQSPLKKRSVFCAACGSENKYKSQVEIGKWGNARNS